MTNKYQNKYRVESTRLQSWDYGWNALYFITICTQNRESYFGDIKGHKIILSEIGKMAEKYWNEIPAHFPFVRLHSYIVMPNHVHGIIQIDKKNNVQTDGATVETQGNAVETQKQVETQNFASLQHKFGPQSQNLASIVRGYKIGVTKNARKIIHGFAWQPRYYDHIIRNEKSYQHISDYIKNNPYKWDEDSLNPEKQTNAETQGNV